MVISAQKKHLVFISSTFLYLQDERKSVANALTRKGMIPTGMELFGANYAPPMSVIRREIREADYYILIVGSNYGSIYKDGLSFTESEYRFAKRTGKKPIVFFPINPTASKEPKDKQHSLEKFKSILSTAHTPEYYTNPDDLGARILSSIDNHMNMFPQPGWVQGHSATKLDVHTDQHERTKFYRDITRSAKEDVFVFGTTLAHVSSDVQMMESKIREGLNYKLIGIDPDYLERSGFKNLYDGFFDKAVSSSDVRLFSERVKSGYDNVMTAALGFKKLNLPGKFEYRTYQFFPTANMTVVDRSKPFSEMVFEHIGKGNERMTFPGIKPDNIAFPRILATYEGYWKNAKVEISI